MNKDNERREFLKKAGAVFTFGMFASSFAAVINSCEQDEVLPAPDPETYDIDLTPFPMLANPGGFTKTNITLKNGSKVNLIIHRIDINNFVVLESICRHMGCEVILPSSANEDILCPCHNVKYDLKTGNITVKPISDPVPNLIKFKVFAYDQAKNVLKVVI